jgi:tetratricopeptide (TPR) repeat protein
VTNPAIRLATEAQVLAQADPEKARQLADNALDQAQATHDYVAAAMAERALGLVETGLEHLPAAAHHLTRSIRYASRAGDAYRQAQARTSLALVLVQQGKAQRAQHELTVAETASRNTTDWGRYLNQRAAVHYHLGQLSQALVDFDDALADSRERNDQVNEARVLSNRALLLVEAGSFQAAARDFAQAAQLAHDAGQTLMAAGIEQNIGWLNARIGDIPTALNAYRRAELEYLRHGETLSTLLLDRCELELGARLLAEAQQSAERARNAAAEGGLLTSVAEADLCLAETRLLSGDPVGAARLARLAEIQFTRQRRKAWAALAHHTLLRARLQSGQADPATARRAALRSARLLDAAGWTERALEARLVAVELAVDLGRISQAEKELRGAAGALRSGPVSIRTRAWHARALVSLAQQDRRGALAAIRSGLETLEQYRAVLGATDLRAAASEHAVVFTRLGIRLALERNRAEEAFRWAELSRASALRIRPVRPPQDEEFAAELTMLRAVVSDISQRASSQPTTGLVQRQAALERAIRDRCRRARPDGLAQPHPPVSGDAVRGALGEQTLIEFIDQDGQLAAITVSDGPFRSWELGRTATAARNVDLALFHLRRLLRVGGPATSRRSVARALASTARQLEEQLLDPLKPVLRDRPLVIVPIGALQSLPWSILPSCRGRAVTVSPSATAWYEANGQAPGRGPVLLAAGPDLPGATAEVAALGALYPQAVQLPVPQATPARVIAALGTASVAHLAAHGRLRTDNPMFSSLVLYGGDLFVHDLEQLPSAPNRVVLSACDVGQSGLRPGDEVLGLAAAFLSLGTASLIAAVLPIPDQATTGVMTALHSKLAVGRSPASALAEVQQAGGMDGLTGIGIASGLICLGAAG